MSFVDAHVDTHALDAFQHALQQQDVSLEPEAKKQQLRDLRDQAPNLSFLDHASDTASQVLAQYTHSEPTSTPQLKPKRVKPPRRATEESPNICHECKTTDSKLWRRGPDGHLMCNACGLRWRRSNRAKDAPKSTPRRRKLLGGRSSSPQSPQAMEFPQSSMMAAQRGVMMNSGLMSTTKYQAQSFGQMQFQSPDIPFVPMQSTFPSPPSYSTKMDATTPIDPALTKDHNKIAGNVKRSMDSRSQDVSSEALPESMHLTSVSTTNGLGNMSVLPGDTPALNESLKLQDMNPLRAVDVGSNGLVDLEYVPVSELPPLHREGDTAAAQVQLQAASQVADLAGDEFADLSFVKAFVEDSGRHF